MRIRLPKVSRLRVAAALVLLLGILSGARAATFVVSPNTTTVYTRVVLKLTGTGTSWLSVPPSLSISGATGATVSLNYVLSNTVAFATVITGAGSNPGNDPARITDSSISAFAGLAVSGVASGSPSYAVVDDVAFSGTVAAGAAGSTITGGRDVVGGAWQISSSKLVGTKLGGNLATEPWLAPGIGTSLNQKVSLTFIGTDNTGNIVTALLRQQSGGPGIIADLEVQSSGSPHIALYRQNADGSFAFGPTVANSGITNINTGHTYRFDVRAEGSAPTLLYFTITDETASTVLYDTTVPTNSSEWPGLAGYFDAPGTCGAIMRAAAQTLTHIKTQAAPSALGLPPVTRTGTGTSTIGLSASAPTGTTGAISYQWYRSATPGFIPGGGNILAGATSSTLTNTPPDGSMYYYKVVATDSAATPNVIISVDMPAKLWQAPIVLGFIGDSLESTIPSGGFRAYPDAVKQHLMQLLGANRLITISNQGVPATMTSNWGTAGSNYITAKAAFAGAGVQYVVVMLGTNDAAFGVDSATYLSNLSPVVTDLVSSGYKVLLATQPYRAQVGPLSNMDVLMVSYQGVLDGLANNTTVYSLSHDLYAYLAQVDESSDGIHPTAAGVETFGWYIARDILGILNPATARSRKVQQ